MECQERPWKLLLQLVRGEVVGRQRIEEDSVAQNAADAVLQDNTHRWVQVGIEGMQISETSLKSGAEDGLC